MEVVLPDVQTKTFCYLCPREYLCQVSNLYLYKSLRYGQSKCLAAILKLKVAPPGAPNLISLSPLRDAPVYEVAWLWLKYFLLYRGNKKSGRIDGRTDGVTYDNY